jgi:hypothetical protein
MQTKPVLGWILAVLLPWGLQSCGEFTNPYKKRDARCKLDCDKKALLTERTMPRSTPPLSLDLVGWLAVMAKSQPDEEKLRGMVSLSPFDLITKVMSQSKSDVKQAQDLVTREAELNENESCYLKAFQNPSTQSTISITMAADFGKCVNLDKLGGLDGKADIHVYDEYERGFQFQAQSPSPLVQASFTQATSPLQLEQLSPFKSLTDFLGNSTEPQEVSLLYTYGALGTDTTFRNKFAISKIRTWNILSLGDPDAKLNLNIDPATNMLKLNGTVWNLEGLALDTQSSSDFKGKESLGFVSTYLFVDFQIHSPGRAFGEKMGISPDAKLTGKYFLVVNDDQYAFRFEGFGEPCLVKVFQLGKDDWIAAGNLDLCKDSSKIAK